MEPLPIELQNLEQQLRAFLPQAPQESPEQLLYQAGWEAALAQQAATAAASPAGSALKSPRSTNHYWAAACAALVLLSTALAWQVWQQPQARSLPITTTTTPAKPQPATKPEPTPAVAAAPPMLVEPRVTEDQPSALASYLELRQRVTRGGLSMWPVSTPVRVDANDNEKPTSRDWQAEVLREAL